MPSQNARQICRGEFSHDNASPCHRAEIYIYIYLYVYIICMCARKGKTSDEIQHSHIPACVTRGNFTGRCMHFQWESLRSCQSISNNKIRNVTTGTPETRFLPSKAPNYLYPFWHHALNISVDYNQPRHMTVIGHTKYIIAKMNPPKINICCLLTRSLGTISLRDKSFSPHSYSFPELRYLNKAVWLNNCLVARERLEIALLPFIWWFNRIICSRCPAAFMADHGRRKKPLAGQPGSSKKLLAVKTFCCATESDAEENEDLEIRLQCQLPDSKMARASIWSTQSYGMASELASPTAFCSRKLFDAVREDELDMVIDELHKLKDKNEINTPGKRGTTLLHLAARYNLASIAAVLLEYGASIDFPSSIGGWTALHIASRWLKIFFLLSIFCTPVTISIMAWLDSFFSLQKTHSQSHTNWNISFRLHPSSRVHGTAADLHNLKSKFYDNFPAICKKSWWRTLATLITVSMCTESSTITSNWQCTCSV